MPRASHGTYWGFSVRVARSLHRVFKDCPYKGGGYDMSIGTSGDRVYGAHQGYDARQGLRCIADVMRRMRESCICDDAPGTTVCSFAGCICFFKHIEHDFARLVLPRFKHVC